ncbi:MAG: four helix bundle protein [Chloroflexi bacterium]|nr:four helix bundle protein [Chloroflexota bacterium]
MTNDQTKRDGKDRKFDLAERTAKFGEEIVRFSKQVPLTVVTTPLVSQLVRAGTSIGANYCEANDAYSKKDFLLKIGLCKKESRETMYWLRMTVAAFPDLKETARKHWDEAHQLNLIFATILNKGRAGE